MIHEFIERWEANKGVLREKFTQSHPEDYEEIVKSVVSILRSADVKWDSPAPSPERITVIDDGGYQGTLVFVIGSDGYQPHRYWYVRIYYGSCSGCDTLEGIRSYSNDIPNESQIDDYMTLCLHIVQQLKEMDDEGEC